jgi:hypothetical protein
VKSSAGVLNVQAHAQSCTLVKHPVGFSLPGIDTLLHALDNLRIFVGFEGSQLALRGPVKTVGCNDLIEQAKKRQVEIYSALTGNCYSCLTELKLETRLTEREAGGFNYWECPIYPAHIGQRIKQDGES